ncbi:MAG: MCE family protein [Verrucomicrobia bacterium]|nr:MCE family protein [Verrucomicrobiota bacterium]MBS0637956.1 MCE family protein [Verrucomicrobiota bacterium]
MREASKNAAIGILVILALGLILWVLLFLHPSFGDGKFQLHVRFNNIEKINIGTRVTYAGRAVGEVTKIQQVPEEGRMEGDDSIYIYDLTLKLDSQIPLYDSDEFTVGTSGLMGERFISIIPRRLKNHQAHRIADNEVVYSTSAPTIDDAFDQLKDLTTEFTKLVKENREELDSTFDSLKSASHQLNIMLTRANEAKLIDNLAQATDQFNQAMTNANSLLADVKKGEGSLGKLLVSNDFYYKTAGVMNKIDLMLNDVNRYGMLFHLDKGWQRDRKRQIDELTALNTPDQFRTFINDESAKITQAVSRLGMALDKAKNDPLETNADFVRTFHDLFVEIQDLQGTLKTYSVELADRQNSTASTIADK